MAEILYAQNTHTFYVSNVQALTGEFLSTASAVVTLYDRTKHTEITGQSWPLTLSYISTTSGDFRGILSASMQVVTNQLLVAQLTITTANAKGYWEVPVVVQVRT